MLDGEREWLSAVVDNLADDNTKLVYADWLQERGDDGRAKFLRKFVALLRTMKREAIPHPYSKKYGEEWLELIGFDIVLQLFRTEFTELLDRLLRVARPALRMKYKRAKDAVVAVGASKVGGLPDLPKGYPWPKGEECKAIYNDDTKGVEELAGFLAQVSLAEIAHTQAARNLPKNGLLSFFAFQDIANDNPDVIGARAIYFPDPAGLVRTRPPAALTEGNKEMPVRRLTFKETLDLPEDYNGPWSKELNLDPETDYDPVFGYFRRVNFENMLGYARATSGDDPTPDKNHRHLILLENAAGCRLHIQIHQKDLAALKFDKIKLVWVDFD